LIITYVVDECEAAILNEIQSRFEVQIFERVRGAVRVDIDIISIHTHNHIPTTHTHIYLTPSK